MAERLKHARFREVDLIDRNPLLLEGEIVFAVDDSDNVINAKIGPGNWNDLSYFIDKEYSDTSIVSNPIGNASGDLSGQTVEEIIYKMLNPYINIELSNPQNNADATYGETRILEIGQSLSSVNVSYAVNVLANLKDVDPININAGGIFTEEGDQAHTGNPITLNAITPLNPNVVTDYVISIKGTGDTGEESTVQTTIKFHPKIIWGVSQTLNIDASGIININDKQELVIDDYKGDYLFNEAGYLYIAIPSMLSGTPVFSDVNSGLVTPVDMINEGSLSINNGAATYNYNIYRTEFYITSNSNTIRIS